jgi:WD40 repeat protein
VAFSGDGALLAAGGFGAVKVWDLATGSERAALAAPGHWSTTLAFSPDGSALTSGGRGYTWARGAEESLSVLRWDVGGKKTPQVLSTPAQALYTPGGHNYCAACAADGRTAAWHHHKRNVVTVADLPRPEGRACFPSAERVCALAFAPDRRLLAAGGERTITLWPVDPAEAQEAARPPSLRRLKAWLWARGLTPARWRTAPRASLAGHTDVVAALAFTADGRLLGSASHDQTVRLWDLATGREVAAFDWGVGKVHALAFAPDGMTAAAGGDADIVVWDLDDLPG